MQIKQHRSLCENFRGVLNAVKTTPSPGRKFPLPLLLGLSGATWGNLGLAGTIWSYLVLPGISGAGWGYLELSGASWAYLGLAGASWSHLGLAGVIWSHSKRRYPGLAGTIWSYLGLSRVVEEYVPHRPPPPVFVPMRSPLDFSVQFMEQLHNRLLPRGMHMPGKAAFCQKCPETDP